MLPTRMTTLPVLCVCVCWGGGVAYKNDNFSGVVCVGGRGGGVTCFVFFVLFFKNLF